MPYGGQTPKERVYTHERYYAKGSRGRRREWTQREIDAIHAEDRRSDAELSVALNRSIRAIQIKRSYTLRGRRV